MFVPARRLVGVALLSVAWLEPAPCQSADAGESLLEGPTVLSADTALEKRPYARPALPDQAAVVIRGEAFTVDFRGAVLQGADPTKVPASDFKGIGILLDGGPTGR